MVPAAMLGLDKVKLHKTTYIVLFMTKIIKFIFNAQHNPARLINVNIFEKHLILKTFTCNF